MGSSTSSNDTPQHTLSYASASQPIYHSGPHPILPVWRTACHMGHSCVLIENHCPLHSQILPLPPDSGALWSVFMHLCPPGLDYSRCSTSVLCYLPLPSREAVSDTNSSGFQSLLHKAVSPNSPSDSEEGDSDNKTSLSESFKLLQALPSGYQALNKARQGGIDTSQNLGHT